MTTEDDTVDQETENGQTAANPHHGAHFEHTDDATQTHGDDEPDTFPRAYVERLRKENATYRERAQRADDLASRLHTSLVDATGRLADPDDLAFDETHLDDGDALTSAIDDLLDRKPHLAARRVTGDVGQGQTGAPGVDLAGMLRARA